MKQLDGQRSPLLQLNAELLQATVLQHLDGRSLAALECTCRPFRALAPRGLRITEAAAREQLVRRCRGILQEAERWRHRSWKERLYIEDAAVGFQTVFAAEAGFAVTEPGVMTTAKDGTMKMQERMLVELAGMGPKLLVSDATTGTHGTLRWRLRVRGNTAVEFGVVPADHCSRHGTLHKVLAPPDRDLHRPGGFCSQITAGSNLSLKASVMRNTIVEMVARAGRLDVLLNNVHGEKEMHWVNGHPVSRLYRGPEQLRFEIDLPMGYDVRLALTAWAKGAFEVLHDLPQHPGASPAKPLPCSSRADSSALQSGSSTQFAAAREPRGLRGSGRQRRGGGQRPPAAHTWERGSQASQTGGGASVAGPPAAPVTPQAPPSLPANGAGTQQGSAARRGGSHAAGAAAPSRGAAVWVPSRLAPSQAGAGGEGSCAAPSYSEEAGDSRTEAGNVDGMDTSSDSSAAQNRRMT